MLVHMFRYVVSPFNFRTRLLDVKYPHGLKLYWVCVLFLCNILQLVPTSIPRQTGFTYHQVLEWLQKRGRRRAIR